MDTNKDGTLTINEIKDAIKKMEKFGEIDEEYKKDLLQSFETDKSQKIEYNDFISACMEQKSYLREEQLINTFMMIDYDGSGKISKAEVKYALNGDVDDETLDKLIQEFDLNGDGEVDYREFIIGLANINKKEEEVKDEKVSPKKHK